MRRNYQKKVKEFIKVIKYQIDLNIGYINLHDYTKVYDLNKSQLLNILSNNNMLNKLKEYNSNF